MHNEPLESCSSFSLTGKAYVDLPLLYGALFATLSQREYAKRQKILIDKLFLALDSLSPKEQQAEQILLSRNLDHEFTTYLYQIRNLIHIKKEKEALTRIAPLENLFYLFEDNIRKRSDKLLAFRYYFSLMEKALAEKVYPDDNIFLLPFDGVSLYILKAQALFRSNRYEEGFLSLHQALELDPVSVDVLFLSAKENQKNNNDFSFENDLERIKEFLFLPRPGRFGWGIFYWDACRIGRRFILCGRLIQCEPLPQLSVLLAQGVELVPLLDARDDRVLDLPAAVGELCRLLL